MAKAKRRPKSLSGLKPLLIVSLCAVLTGCVSSRTDYAQASPSDQQTIDRLEAQAKAKLKDPYSAVVEKKVGNYDANGKLTSACFYINAKNVYGAYTGVQPTCEFL